MDHFVFAKNQQGQQHQQEQHAAGQKQPPSGITRALANHEHSLAHRMPAEQQRA